MEKLKFEFKKNEGILEKALAEVNLEENDIFYSIKEEKVGLLKNKKYILEIVKKEDICSLGKEILTDLLKGLGVNAKIETRIKQQNVSFEIYSDNSSILIGRRGTVLSSIQTFLKQAIYNRLGMFVNIFVDSENYKDKQYSYLIRDVKRIAKEVTLSKISVSLDPMNSYLRKLVHDALTDFEYIDAKSEGEEPNRKIVITYKEKE
ncbi:MAG: R3H domain-containing nucleic acid-binding protein [Bacilli bacterium]